MRARRPSIDIVDLRVALAASEPGQPRRPRRRRLRRAGSGAREAEQRLGGGCGSLEMRRRGGRERRDRRRFGTASRPRLRTTSRLTATALRAFRRSCATRVRQVPSQMRRPQSSGTVRRSPGSVTQIHVVRGGGDVLVTRRARHRPMQPNGLHVLLHGDRRCCRPRAA